MRPEKKKKTRMVSTLRSSLGLECLDSVARQAALSSTGERPSTLEPQTDFSGRSLCPEAAFVAIPAVSHKEQEQMQSPKGGGEAVNVCLPRPPNPPVAAFALVEVN